VQVKNIFFDELKNNKERIFKLATNGRLCDERIYEEVFVRKTNASLKIHTLNVLKCPLIA
jgi:hypothetical protein